MLPTSPSPTASTPVIPQPALGLWSALLILGLWGTSLVTFVFLIDWSERSLLWMGLAVLWQTFLYTGLFITAHDAMHGVVLPTNLRLNHCIGAIAVLLFALFDYQQLLTKHWQHHKAPASDRDPDYHAPDRDGFWQWYLHFMGNYSTWSSMLGFTAIFNGLTLGLQLPRFNLVVFWILPSILSSLQLFYFGTYLPHRRPPEGYRDRHRTRSYRFGYLLSFLACYHFNYHEEHHRYPHLRWWQLPAASLERDAARL